MKHKIAIVVLIIAVTAAIFLFPIRLTSMIPTDSDINVLWLESGVTLADGGDTAYPTNESRSYTIKSGTPEHEALKEILGKYYCHLTLRTIFGNNSTVECSNNVLYINSELSENMITGMAQAQFGEKIYHIGYFGNAKAEELTEELCTLLKGLESETDE